VPGTFETKVSSFLFMVLRTLIEFYS
jgi:hypothetical protein